VLEWTEIAICLLVLCFLATRGALREYWALGAFLAVRALSDSTLMGLRLLARQIGKQSAYKIYFFVYWPSFAVESVLAILILYGVLRIAMAPLKGLQWLGRRVFIGVALVSCLVSLWVCLGVHSTGIGALVFVISQLQRAQSMFVLCLLLFITFALRPLGLTYRSRTFGITLGLGIMSTNDLVQSWWLTFHPNMPTTFALFNGVLFCAILLLWTIYFALPEPGRKELNSDSPIRRWNEACVGFCGEVN
jgi:hypothetical protein